MAKSLSNILLKGISALAACSISFASQSFYYHGMQFSTTVPGDPDTHDDFKPTNKLQSSCLSLKDIFEQVVGSSFPTMPIFARIEVPVAARNILEDPELEDAVKAVSHWPIFPQIFIKGEFIGESDIILSIHENGELKEKLKDVLEI